MWKAEEKQKPSWFFMNHNDFKFHFLLMILSYSNWFRNGKWVLRQNWSEFKEINKKIFDKKYNQSTWIHKICQSKQCHHLKRASFLPTSKSPLPKAKAKETMWQLFAFWTFQDLWIVRLLKGSQPNRMVSAGWILSSIQLTQSSIH